LCRKALREVARQNFAAVGPGRTQWRRHDEDASAAHRISSTSSCFITTHLGLEWYRSTVPERDDDELDESAPEADLDEADDAPRRRRRMERILPDAIKRAIEKGIESGIGTFANANESIRGMVGQRSEMPKDVANYVLSQIDDGKNAAVSVVAREVREFLERADLARELQRALTSLSFEIRTEIRFIPNDAGGVTPEVKAKVDSKRTKDEAPRRNRRSGSEFPEPNED
jgi:hypothetical protein